MVFKAPWLVEEKAVPPPERPAGPHCKFITSYGGAAYCQDLVYLLGFCRFHFDAFERAEIDENGRISDHLDDQDRRRAINYHGLKLPDSLKPAF